MTVHVLDKYYLSITLLVTIGYQLAGFAIAWTFKFDKITDFTGGSNFFVLALLTLLLGNTFHARNIVASVLVMIWATRLGGFLLFRVLKRGSDSRFDDIRSHFFKFLGVQPFEPGSGVVTEIIYVIQQDFGLAKSSGCGFVSEISEGGNNPKFGQGADIAGIVLFALGWLVETIADIQKYRYKSAKPPKTEPCTSGLWKYSRHPPYAGEITVWWGIWVLCLTPSRHGDLSSSAMRAQYAAIVSPLFTMILLIFLSGIPTAEKPQAKRYFLMSQKPEYSGAWSNYKQYVERTSVLWLVPPSLYVKFPRWLKRTVFLELDFIWGFDEVKDGEKALEEQRMRDRENA
ncbi:hypothetical protein FRC02_008796 [Tulasnella sp. 418]|nr:hypothetical protein FRC02_008796 [Tulasnella sp. 418]